MNEPNKADRKRWAAEAHVNKAWREALGEDRKRQWVARAVREDRCPSCGEAPAQRCADNGNCMEAVLELHARQKAAEGSPPSPPAGACVLTPARRAQLGF
jgi:hypothetical protein